MEFWLLEHMRDTGHAHSEIYDAGWIPCGLFTSLEAAQQAAEQHTDGAFYDGWHISEWPGGDCAYLRYYETQPGMPGNGWRIKSLMVGQFKLHYAGDTRA